ncbi:MAG: radical SAM protein [Deltaproteobacteria bacterium]|nr:radical SAM protein [Deltaproteobacteria bacterium]
MNELQAPGLYVHVPFCRTKCPYCDFYSVTDASGVSRWLEALRMECRLAPEDVGPFDSLYVGGGTPSCLSDHHLDLLVGTLLDSFSFSPDLEFTLEANPDDLTVARLKRFRE